MPKLVLLRHGQSQWNLENRFTGWTDVGLTDQGRAEARQAGRSMQAEGLDFDVCWTSVLKRAVQTLWLSLEEMEREWLPVERDWRLNERHYGALQGLNKAETAAKHGEEQVHIWRRSYDIPPPSLELEDERHPRHDRRYAGLDPKLLPGSECLKDTVDRFLPLWHETIAPSIRDGQRILIVAHGNSLRALVKFLDGISDQAIVGLNIPTGVPLVYDLDDELKPIESRYLMDPEELARMQKAVADQGKAKD